jgi:HTH-type transcriptional regulator, transcriptional repressor of NAD biosynthesis genes
VDEYARTYIEDKIRRAGENCGLEDILAIAIGQQASENQVALETGQGLVICDTDLLTIKAYSDLFFGRSPEAIDAALPFAHYDLYLLTDIDVPWEADGIRDRPNERSAMLAYFEHLLQRYDRRYVKISGDRDRRLRLAIGAVEHLLEAP